MYLCEICGGAFDCPVEENSSFVDGRGGRRREKSLHCPICGEPYYKRALPCPLCGGWRKEEALLCEHCERQLELQVQEFLEGLTEPERETLDLWLDGESLLERFMLD